MTLELIPRAPGDRTRTPRTSVASPTRTATAPKTKTRTRSAKSTFHLVVRRLHLYFGLFLLPWVLLYGVTAFLFNHPGAASEREVRVIGAERLAGTVLDETPDPDALADMVVAALRTHWNERTPEGATPPSFSDARDAALDGRVFVRFEDDVEDASPRRTHTAIAPWNGVGVKLYSTPIETDPDREDAQAFAVKEGLTLDASPYADVTTELAAVVGSFEGVPVREDRLGSLPRLSFALDVDGEPWNATYDFEEGALSARRGVPEPRTMRSRLLRLHTAHGFPVEGGAPWWWAVIVDLMAVSMVGWSVTGVILWWQIKKVRAWGAVALVASVATAAALYAGMVAEIG